MRIMKLSMILAVFVLFLTMACSKKESPFPSEPRSASGTTNSGGEIELDLGSHVITVKVVNESEIGIGNIDVTGYLLKDFFFAFAGGNSSYYSGFAVVDYETMEAEDEIRYTPRISAGQSPQSFQTIKADVQIMLHDVTRDVYSYYEEPPNNEAVFTDDWTTATAYLGTLEDVYNLADSINDEGGLIVHITNNVAISSMAEVQTVSVAMNQVSDLATFVVLMGLEFHIFEADTVNINYISYSDSILPVVYINSIIMSEGSFFAQFTLTWDEDPQDLDSHLWTPLVETDSFHIYFASQGNGASPPYAFLDVDDVTSWGPEHIVVYQGFAGLYTFAVHHYSGQSDIPNSGAEVSLLKPDRTVQKFTPPDTTAQSGYYWHVCTIDGITGEVTPLDIISADPPLSYINAGRMPSKNY